jgi:hypothetical protein
MASGEEEKSEYPPQASRRKAKAVRPRDAAVDTALGAVTIKNRYDHSAAIIGLGQTEAHLRWYYDVYRKRILSHAIENLNKYLDGKKERSAWSESYFEFMQTAPELLKALPEQGESALLENRARIERKEVRVLGTYKSVAEAEEAVTRLTKRYEPNGGWLNVHVVMLPKDSTVGAGSSP